MRLPLFIIIGLVLFSVVVAANVDDPAGSFLWQAWTFEEGVSNLTKENISGKVGQMQVNTAWTTGIIQDSAYSLKFATGDWVDLNTLAPGAGSRCMILWMNNSNCDAGSYVLTMGAAATRQEISLGFINPGGGVCRPYIDLNGDSYNPGTAGDFLTGQRVMMSIGYDGSNIHMYRNVTEIGSGAAKALNIGSTHGVKLGRRLAEAPIYPGTVDQFLMYNTSCNASMLTYWHNNAVGREYVTYVPAPPGIPGTINISVSSPVNQSVLNQSAAKISFAGSCNASDQALSNFSATLYNGSSSFFVISGNSSSISSSFNATSLSDGNYSVDWVCTNQSLSAATVRNVLTLFSSSQVPPFIPIVAVSSPSNGSLINQSMSLLDLAGTCSNVSVVNFSAVLHNVSGVWASSSVASSSLSASLNLSSVSDGSYFLNWSCRGSESGVNVSLRQSIDLLSYVYVTPVNNSLSTPGTSFSFYECPAANITQLLLFIFFFFFALGLFSLSMIWEIAAFKWMAGILIIILGLSAWACLFWAGLSMVIVGLFMLFKSNVKKRRWFDYG